MKTPSVLPLIGCLLLLLQPAAAAEPPGAWPHGTRAAVSLAYDDALPSQLDVAIPALDRHGLQGSFYLTLAAPTLTTRLAEWRAAAARGHELGNHTLFHQCSGKGPDRGWVTPELDLDRTSAEQMASQIRLASTMLHAIDGRTARTYTLPCGERLAAGGVDYVPSIRDGFVAIKTAGPAVVPDLARLDPHDVGVFAPVGLTGDELIAMVKQAGERGTMVNFTFHGIGADYLQTSAEAHEQLLAFLAAHRDEYWTASFVDIMTWVKARSGAGDTHAHGVE